MMAFRPAGSRSENLISTPNFNSQFQSSEICSRPLPQDEHILRNHGDDYRRFKASQHLLGVLFAVLCLLLFSAILLSLAGKNPEVRLLAFGERRQNAQRSWSLEDAQTNWPTGTARRAEWEAPNKEDGRNWAGRQTMHKKLADGAFWWDERAEQYVTSKLEESQFPADCSKSHRIGKPEMTSGLLAAAHIFQFPLFFSMMRGFTLVPITDPNNPATFLRGCSPEPADHNLRCFFNITHCEPGEEDSLRMTNILSQDDEDQRTTWDELLMEKDEFFPPGGLSVAHTSKLGSWNSRACVNSSSFSSFLEAYNYNKMSLWHGMGRLGKSGVRRPRHPPHEKKLDICPPAPKGSEAIMARRVDMVITSLMSSWMLERVSNNVKLVADQIMSRYMDSSGKPLWKSPVLVIDVRKNDDKTREDRHWEENAENIPTEDYADTMKQMEEEYGFQWPSVFIISDVGTATTSLITMINEQENSETPQERTERFIMHDWSADHHLIMESNNFTEGVPEDLENDMQTHLLATLYIVQKIADHAIVTYGSNVGRFIGEIMAAKHRLALVDGNGPVTTALDREWRSLERTNLERGTDTL